MNSDPAVNVIASLLDPSFPHYDPSKCGPTKPQEPFVVMLMHTNIAYFFKVFSVYRQPIGQQILAAQNGILKAANLSEGIDYKVFLDYGRIDMTRKAFVLALLASPDSARWQEIIRSSLPILAPFLALDVAVAAEETSVLVSSSPLLPATATAPFVENEYSDPPPVIAPLQPPLVAAAPVVQSTQHRNNEYINTPAFKMHFRQLGWCFQHFRNGKDKLDITQRVACDAFGYSSTHRMCFRVDTIPLIEGTEYIKKPDGKIAVTLLGFKILYLRAETKFMKAVRVEHQRGNYRPPVEIDLCQSLESLPEFRENMAVIEECPRGSAVDIEALKDGLRRLIQEAKASGKPFPIKITKELTESIGWSESSCIYDRLKTKPIGDNMYEVCT